MPISRVNVPYRQRQVLSELPNPWQKSYGVTSNLNLDGIVKWGVIGLAGLMAIYVIAPDMWSRLVNWYQNIGDTTPDQTTAVCPTGYHSVDRCADLTGLPKTLCGLGGYVTGGLLDCEKDSVDGGSGTGGGIGGYCIPNPFDVLDCSLRNGNWSIEQCACVQPDVFTSCDYVGQRRCLDGKRQTCIDGLGGMRYWEYNLMNGNFAPCLPGDINV